MGFQQLTFFNACFSLKNTVNASPAYIQKILKIVLTKQQ
ncbi:hypothetical protein CHY_0449 [Carboxydothermus hydrogenoformans Z-2901]|uniref:Uncharacterized protein n=1 Tax=Carboxydothermus hydrogenoformans (strain ATCC BAA-161 / DSM 6008 / Z-2901) TaxID=246194 RepID=Q3AEX4_CARHZ|nr:hypothetical protein CHY_0449 [Carboxydothermus hydrogenoformans Z-2901]